MKSILKNIQPRKRVQPELDGHQKIAAFPIELLWSSDICDAKPRVGLGRNPGLSIFNSSGVLGVGLLSDSVKIPYEKPNLVFKGIE